MKKLLLILGFLIITCTSAIADVFEHPQKLSEIMTQLPQLESVKCKFRQEKFISTSNITLKSSGDFEFIKGTGVNNRVNNGINNNGKVIFNTTYPIQSTTSYGESDYKQINEIINAISNKSYSKIENGFDFYFTNHSENWTLGLTPKKVSPAYKYLKSIEIEGQNDISKIIINTKNSTKTTIWFYK